jgi:preprotein translocase SecE subunit
LARQTRQQRRQRRAQTEPALAGGPPARPPVRPVERDGSGEPSRRPERAPAGVERRAPGGGLLNFVQEAWAELKKVEWPSQHAVVSGTAVVLVACVIVGFYLWLNDEAWKYVVQHVLLR